MQMPDKGKRKSDITLMRIMKMMVHMSFSGEWGKKIPEKWYLGICCMEDVKQ